MEAQDCSFTSCWRIVLILRQTKMNLLWISLKRMLISPLSVHGKGFSKSSVDNLKGLWISLIAKGKNFANFCMPQSGEVGVRLRKDACRNSRERKQINFVTCIVNHGSSRYHGVGIIDSKKRNNNGASRTNTGRKQE